MDGKLSEGSRISEVVDQIKEDGPLAKKAVEQARRQSVIDLGNTIKDARDEEVEVKDFSSKKEGER